MKPRTKNSVLSVICVCLIVCAAIFSGKIRRAGEDIKAIQQRCDSLTRHLDSVSHELSYYEMQTNRYEVAYKIFSRRNPNAAEQYGNIISEETQ